ncbi:MAG: hypothetical protein WAW17_08195 [Rhodococcus sp. (in: high G+C Gram-positive bacteria)]|uniref:hypothetical protein n=1 Tax=Rhodococcus sp. TaxID=1831 RepID=UPI003BB0CBBA
MSTQEIELRIGAMFADREEDEQPMMLHGKAEPRPPAALRRLLFIAEPGRVRRGRRLVCDALVRDN